MKLDFYHGHGSPFSWRVWLALEHLGVPYELKILSFADKDTRKPGFLAVNPRGKVPTIVDDGFAVGESIVILDYLEERFGSDRARLYPGDLRERTRIRKLVREVEQYVDEGGISVFYDEFFAKAEGVARDEEKVRAGHAQLTEEFVRFGKELRGAFLAGDKPTAADFVLYPEVGYVKRMTFRKPETRLTETLSPAIAQWASRIEALPYFDKTFPPHWK